jgi:hypothetical protein
MLTLLACDTLSTEIQRFFMKAQTLQLPEATLYYETRDSGTMLLLIARRGTDADVFKGKDSYRFRTK